MLEKLPVSWLPTLLSSLTCLLLSGPLQAQESWLFVPAYEGSDEQHAPVESMLTPWEQALPRSVRNSAAASIYEQRVAAPASEPSSEIRAQAVAVLDRALQQLALGNMDEATQTLREISELPQPKRDGLLHSQNIAQKLFDACVMRAYLLERKNSQADAMEQLRVCARDFPRYANTARAFTPVVHGPPQLRAEYERIRAELTRANVGRLSITSGNKHCPTFVNGLAVGETPLRLSQMPEGTMRVSLQCDKLQGRVHKVDLSATEATLHIDPQLDAHIVTRGLLQLHYNSRSERESFLAKDALALQETLGVDRIAILAVVPRGNAWTIAVHALDPDRHVLRAIAELAFSEVASYEPKRLQITVDALSGRSLPKAPADDSTSAPVVLTPNEAPDAPPVPPMPAARQADETSGSSPVVGGVTAAVGAIGLAAGWVLLLQTREYRTTSRSTADDSVLAEYHRREAFTIATSLAGAIVLAGSAYFYLPSVDEVPAYAWVVGSLGLAAAAAGIGLTVSHEHCEPVDDEHWRSLCGSILAERYFGVEIALTAMPFIALPFMYLLRLGGSDVSVGIETRPGGLSLTATLKNF